MSASMPANTEQTAVRNRSPKYRPSVPPLSSITASRRRDASRNTLGEESNRVSDKGRRFYDHPPRDRDDPKPQGEDERRILCEDRGRHIDREDGAGKPYNPQCRHTADREQHRDSAALARRARRS